MLAFPETISVCAGVWRWRWPRGRDSANVNKSMAATNTLTQTRSLVRMQESPLQLIVGYPKKYIGNDGYGRIASRVISE